MNRNRSVQLVLFALFAMFALSACNTIEGFGRDVKKAGGELEEAAEEVRN